LNSDPSLIGRRFLGSSPFGQGCIFSDILNEGAEMVEKLQMLLHPRFVNKRSSERKGGLTRAAVISKGANFSLSNENSKPLGAMVELKWWSPKMARFGDI